MESATGLAVLDLELLWRVLAAYGEKGLFAAVGWFLERQQRALFVPDDFLRRLEKHRPKSPHYLLRGSEAVGSPGAGVSSCRTPWCSRESPMSVSQERLRDASAETGFRAEALEKVIRLGELASDVFSHPFLGPALALKGGTALNLAFGPPPRLSVDLDFNYVASVEREVMLRDRPEVERALEQLAHGRKYRVQRSRHDHAGRKIYLGYRAQMVPPTVSKSISTSFFGSRWVRFSSRSFGNQAIWLGLEPESCRWRSWRRGSSARYLPERRLATCTTWFACRPASARYARSPGFRVSSWPWPASSIIRSSITVRSASPA